MNAQILTKWKPVLDSLFHPYELENEILEMIAEYMETNLEINVNSPCLLPGMGVQYPLSAYSLPKMNQEDVLKIIREFKERLAQDIDIRIDIKNVYYNGTIKRIVYELANGDSVYLETKPLIMKDPDYIKRSKNLFLSISDPKNPQVRRMKIEDIKNNM